MWITFLIGNGFDLNLGLKTKYSDFISAYKKQIEGNSGLQSFSKYIKDNLDLWSDAELAFGEFTQHLKEGDGKFFSDCHVDFCEKLALYLKQEQNRICYEKHIDKIQAMFKKIDINLNIDKSILFDEFPSQERGDILRMCKRYSDETMYFNFICYNYTETLDKCIAMLGQKSRTIGAHYYKQTEKKHTITGVYHVHGTVEQNMVFGVNDESQIKNNSVFECKNGHIMKNMFIKKSANDSFREGMDEVGMSILQNSNIIYIYGMSIGATDRLWWERINDWLSGSQDRHLIIHRCDVPTKQVVFTNYALYLAEQYDNFLDYCKNSRDNSDRENIAKRIHIARENIFHDIAGIADSSSEQENIADMK